MLGAALERSRRYRNAVILVTTVFLAFAGCLPVAADATTGPGYLLNPPKYRIPLSVLKAYTGRYVSTSITPGPSIVSSELYIGVAASGYAAGGISIYSYDRQGMLQTYAGTIYNFRLVGKGAEADLVSTDGTTVLGHVTVQHAGSSRNLVGTLEPPTGGQYRVDYRYAASEGPLPGQAYAPVAPAPGSGARPASSPKPATSSNPQAGWGSPARFIGRYRLIVGTPIAQLPAPAGIFSRAAAAADRLLASAQTPTGGELTLFMRTVKKTEPPMPSGILSVDTQAGSYVLYLTNLRSDGPMRSATVHGGAFLGPTIGSLTGMSGGRRTLTATVTARAIGTFSVRFVRFSSTPAP
jgi:hypothetical protein